MNNNELMNFVEQTPDWKAQDAILKANTHINLNPKFKKIACSISGGSDSDIMLHLLHNLDVKNKITYIWFDTGLEYEATKRHLKELEQRYNIKIVPLKAKKPIPTAVREYGVPFLSKLVSEWISRLQRHNFQWEDEDFETLYKRYPKCKAALRWWCNDWPRGKASKFNISHNAWLKEFMIQNPPTFPISSQCCYFAKKAPANDFVLNGDFDLNCVGVRKSEGGARSAAHKSCFTPDYSGVSQYRPLFWFDNQSKEIYKKSHNIVYSDCYEIWGLSRTGCAACPFGKNFEFELECIQKYEPKLYKAVHKIFGASYEYTRAYRNFQNEMRKNNA